MVRMSTTAPHVYGDPGQEYQPTTPRFYVEPPPPPPRRIMPPRPPRPPKPEPEPIPFADADTADELYRRAVHAVINEAGVPVNLDTIRGAMVRLRREDCGFQQVDLARRVPTTQQSVSRIELGTQVPNDDLRVRIAKALGITTARLFLYADAWEELT